jgi:hypothetical protein
MMILLGKHQFNVSSISDVSVGSEMDHRLSPRQQSAPNVLKGLVSDAERLVADFEKVRLDAKGDADIEKRLRELTTKLSTHCENESLQGGAKEDSHFISDANELDVDEAVADAKTGVEYPVGSAADKKSFGHKSDKMAKRCVLTCFFPDGSPLQGKNFVVGEDGATLGRRQSNLIALFVKVLCNGLSASHYLMRLTDGGKW